MSTFTTPADLRLLSRRKWMVLAAFEYHEGGFPSDTVYCVPVGFVTDLATIPRLLWPIFPPDGEYAKAAILHDWLYSVGIVDRKDADQLFLEAMTVLGVDHLTRLLMYRAVRVFGAKNYSRRLNEGQRNCLVDWSIQREDD